ncbi:hypothetical protein CLV30_102257 [Haloactinopolyspora alba]|uniref:V8-like Glu-specific endopeptidase n=1 Tax=Haloactinopolyspora alba TaxID=648780 RepID=A0A2P8EBM2_9ACTN|nr:hypothetical protein [Haloactinopolyspora alba]PSL06868.1 hypothetical protein CLV30_102257 [Haloactinopolyspora alba]
MRKVAVQSLLTGLVLAMGATAAPALATADGTTTTSGSVVSHQLPTLEAQDATQGWTAERMEAAIPADVRRTPHGRAAPAPHGADVAPAADPESPRPELGKVFFTLGGVDYVCSGTATTSQNRDVVTTAGHCVHEGDGGAFASSFTFVPAYDDGAAPHGQWSASTLYTSSGWANSGDFAVDVGFAVLNENASGQSLTDVVGSYPIAFDQPRGLTYTSYGYPAGSPFDGQQLYSCSGAAHDDPYGAGTQGIPCNMTGGSSGGGWITGGSLNSVNSYKYTNDPNTMYGPYFGSTARAVYDAAATS